MVQMELSMGEISQQKHFLEARANLTKSWEELLAHTNTQDRDAPLPDDFYEDPDSPVVATLVFLYQMQSYVYEELNRACRYKDTSKLPTLGPYAYALGYIIGNTQGYRKDKEKYDCWKQQDLWRGGGATADEIDQYRQMVGKYEDIYLHGYTSTSIT